MESTVIPTVQMTGMRTIIAGCQAVRCKQRILMELVELAAVHRLVNTVTAYAA
ncbi:MAG: hypothetical protein HDR05_02130 [Lachnospiraceae bacterium]|nr:hypothetical protein [Lachnospiraceae bacterium]